MFDLPTYQQLIASVDAATTNQEKGSRFETLCEYLFGCLDGVRVQGRDVRMTSEEIDLVLWNAQIEEVLKPWEFVILVECKNWSQALGAPILDSFIAKLRRRALKTGILIAANGVTGGFINGDGDDVGAVGIIRGALQEGIRVITITMDDLRQISSADELRDLIRKRYCGIFVHKVF
jgi:hypothetical protein